MRSILRRFGAYSGIFVLLMANAIIFERFLSQQTFSLLELRNEIIVSKRRMEMTLMGSDFYLLGRAAVAQGKLHLDRWFGFQEVTFHEPFDLKSLSVEVAVHNRGNFTVFRTDPAGFSEGFRISRTSLDYFRATPNGEWIHQETFGVPKLRTHSPGILNRLSASARNEELPEFELDLELQEHARNLKVTIDGILLKEFSVTGTDGVWGIRGNDQPVTIDEVVVRTKSGRVFRESFEPPVDVLLVLVFSLATGLSFLGLVFLRLRRPAVYSGLFFSLYVSLITISAIFLIDRYHLTNFQFELFGNLLRSRTQQEVRLIEFERARFSFFGQFLGRQVSHEILHSAYPERQIWRGPISCAGSTECFAGIPSARQPGPRLLLIGSSQTIGAGASVLENTFFVKLHRALLPRWKQLHSRNISVSGGTPAEMLDLARETVREFVPDILIINLGVNSATIVDYRAAMKGFVALKGTAKVFIVNEAALGKEHKMKEIIAFNGELCRRHGFTLVHLYENIDGYTRTGKASVWWDFVHFNDLGNDLAARAISREILLP